MIKILKVEEGASAYYPRAWLCSPIKCLATLNPLCSSPNFTSSRATTHHSIFNSSAMNTNTSASVIKVRVLWVEKFSEQCWPGPLNRGSMHRLPLAGRVILCTTVATKCSLAGGYCGRVRQPVPHAAGSWVRDWVFLISLFSMVALVSCL